MADEPQPATPTPRWRRVLKGLIVALVLLAVVVVGGVELLPRAWLGRQVARRVEAELGRACSIRRARFSFFSGFHASDVTVMRREGFGDGPLFGAERVDVEVSLWGLLRGRTHVRRVTVERATLELATDRHGTLNIQDLIERPRPERPVTVGSARLEGLAIGVCHLPTGDEHRAELMALHVGARDAEHRRWVRVHALVPQGGTLWIDGPVWMAPTAEEFHHAEVKVVAKSLAVGRIARDVAGLRLPRPDLADALVDASLDVRLDADRQGSGSGTITVRGLPAVAQLGFTSPERAIELQVSVDHWPKHRHIEVRATTRPDPRVRLTAFIDPVAGSERAYAFALDTYTIDAQLAAEADLSQGGLPGTRVAAGKASVEAGLKGHLRDLAATLTARLEGGGVRVPGGEIAPLPPLTLEAEAIGAPGELSGELKRLALEADGLLVEAAAHVRPAPGAEPQIEHDGSLPPMVAGATLKASGDLSRWPTGLRALLGVSTEGRMAGSVAANASFDLNPDRIAASSSLRVTRFGVEGEGWRVPPADLTAQARGDFDRRTKTLRFRDAAVTGEGIEGSLKGELALGPEVKGGEAEGSLDADLAILARRYGALVGLPRDLRVQGTFTARVGARRAAETLASQGSAVLTNLRIGRAKGAGDLIAETKAGLAHALRWDVAQKRLHLNELRLILASGRGGLEASGTATAEQLDLAVSGAVPEGLLDLLPGRPAALKVIGPAVFEAKVTGTPFKAVRVAGTLDATDNTVAYATDFAKPGGMPARLTFDATLGEAIDARHLELQLGKAKASGWLKASWGFRRIDDARLKADRLDLAALTVFLPMFGLYEPQGHATVDLTLQGPSESPTLVGSVVFDKCSALVSDYSDERVTVSGTLQAKGTVVSTSGLQAALGHTQARIDASIEQPFAFPNAKVTAKIDASELRIDEMLTIFLPEDIPKPIKTKPEPIVLPIAPAGLDGPLELAIGKVSHGKQVVEKLRLVGTLAGRGFRLTELAGKAGDGLLTGSGRIALGAGRHELKLRTDRLPLNQDLFDLIRRVPHLKFVTAALPFYDVLVAFMGGRPDELHFLATMDGRFEGEGQDLDRILATLSGKADATLTDIRFAGSPLFRRVATVFGQSDLAGLTRIERATAPFHVGDGRVHLKLTVPYQKAHLILQGSTLLAGEMAYDYVLRVSNPKGIRGLPDLVRDYLDAGNPVARITGTRGAPVLGIPTADILRFGIQRRLKGQGKGND